MRAGDDLENDTPPKKKSGFATANIEKLLQSRPGKRGLPLNISAKTHPTLHISMARVYSLKVSITSGARYHLIEIINEFL